MTGFPTGGGTASSSSSRMLPKSRTLLWNPPQLASHVGITETNLSLLKSGRVKGIRFETLDAICAYLECQPGDILVHEPDA